MIRRLAEGVWWLQFGPMAPLRQNAFLVDDDGTLTLVDAGLPWDAGTLEDHLASVGYDLDDLDRVLVTHYDLDHVGGLLRLVPDLDATVYMHGTDADLARGDHDPPLLHHKGAFHRGLRLLYPLPVDGVDLVELADGETVGGFTAYHTPGHNPGHLVFVHEDLSAAFLGDLVWADGDGLTTPILFDSYDMTELGDSVRDLADRVPSFEIAAMGHGTPLESDGSEALRRLAADID